MLETTKSNSLPPEFQAAINAMDKGDVSGLEDLLATNPDLVRQTAPHDESEPVNYFSGASLIHYVAGNPNRGNLPQKIVESAAALLRAGADANARTLSGSTTIGLILTSKDASESGVGPALIDLLKAAGATDDLDNEETLLSPLRNCAYSTARALWERGYQAGIRAAAGLGQVELARKLLQTKSTGQISRQEELDQALTYAVTHSHTEVAGLLLQQGANINSIPAVYGNPGTALHIAPTAAMAQFLVEHGADNSIKDPTFHAIPADWAKYGGNAELIAYFESLKS